MTVEKSSSELTALAQGRDSIPTNEAAPWLSRQTQTLRKWACCNSGPIVPVRINGRLHWKVSDLMDLLKGVQK